MECIKEMLCLVEVIHFKFSTKATMSKLILIVLLAAICVNTVMADDDYNMDTLGYVFELIGAMLHVASDLMGNDDSENRVD
ncbi:hypothetical protein HDE_02190 [Halotydeus destructor]|nr:hypothetical protein HDE_02190 [Halotydeus destructor]